ncbi:MAG: hypothetical protein R3F30_14365 [Planctomycetota bacterium]
MMRSLLAAALLLLPSCVELGAKVDIGYTRIDPKGSLALDSSGSGNLLSLENDLQDDLGLTNEADSMYGHVELDAVMFHFTASAFRIEDKAQGTLRADFGGITASTPVETDFDVTNYRATAGFNLLNLAGVRISPGVGVNVLDSKTTVRSLISPLEEDLKGTVPVPFLSLDAGLEISIVDVSLGLGWINGHYGDFEGEMFDLEALARLRILDPVHVFVGYRLVRMDVEGEQDGDTGRFDLDWQGWTAGVGIDF